MRIQMLGIGRISARAVPLPDAALPANSRSTGEIQIPGGLMTLKHTEADGRRSKLSEYAEAIALIAVLTAIAWQFPLRYRAFSHIYLLGVVAIGLRVGRGPVLLAAILSAASWDFFTIPPRLSFTVLDADDVAMLAAYIVVALIVSELAAQIRAQGEHLGAANERAALLAESDRLHRALFDSVSHELKTPLTVIRTAAPALRKRTTGEQAELAREICQATDRLDRLVENLLDQTRLESGILAPQLDWCDARDLVQAACAATQESLEGRLIRTEIAENMSLLRVDTTLMEQAIGNLLLNAALYTPQGTPITVRSGLDAGRNQAFISVEDEGPGISADLRGRLFQKFQRGTASHPGGLGLGLSIVHGFVAAQGGEVAAENKKGGGAMFTIFLPIAPCEAVPND
jgi:K+-sensing histidine kinase KdpD